MLYCASDTLHIAECLKHDNMSSFSQPLLSQPFSSLTDLHDVCLTLPGPHLSAQEAIARREGTLTKPAGSLGQLEKLTSWLGTWQKKSLPQLSKVNILIFAGNHGVVAQNVSPWSAEVTTQMVQNFRHGGAAINQIAQVSQAALSVIPVAELTPTADFTLAPAMTEQAFLHAVNIGYNSVPHDSSLVCLGEMGIGNTTAAAALAALLFGGDSLLWSGRGTGLDDDGVKRKAAVVDTARALHAAESTSPLELARRAGGYELAAIMGATLAARHLSVPVLLDGYVCTAAVAPLFKLNPQGLAHTWLAHCSAEAGHARLAQAVGLTPLLSLDMRLGEGSGAALAIPVLRAAIACHTKMATFSEASVTKRR